MAGVLATRWKDIQGLNDWKGLLDPLDPELRKAGIRYGEFVEAMYDAIDMEEGQYMYYSLFGKSSLFSRVALPDTKYTITRFLYSTVSIDRLGELFGSKTGTAWIGYIAVSNDEETKRIGRRDVVVIFRGTKASGEWWTNSQLNVVEYRGMGPAPYPKVHQGFLSMYTASDASKPFGESSLKDQMYKELQTLMQQYAKEDMSITFLGHSMGAGMVTLAASDFGYNLKKDDARTVMVTAFVFGAPKAGDSEFKKKTEASIKVLRIVSTGDPVVILPPVSILPPAIYEHVGVVWKVDWNVSPFVQDLGFLSMKCHNLELYLHCIAGQKKQPAAMNSTSSKLANVLKTHADDPVEVPQELASLKEMFKDDLETLEEHLLESAAIVKTSRLLSEPPRKRARTVVSPGTVLQDPDAFELVIKRDFALMNKSDDVIKEEFNIPKSWWVHQMKNMRHIGDAWLPRHSWPPEDIPTDDNPEFN